MKVDLLQINDFAVQLKLSLNTNQLEFGDKLTFVFASSPTLEIVDDSSFYYYGNTDDGYIYISKYGEQIFGTIETDKDLYQIEGINSSVSLFIKKDKGKIKKAKCGVEGHNHKDDTIDKSSKSGSLNLGNIDINSSMSCSDTRISLLVLFTSNATNSGINRAAMANDIVNQFNQAASNSRIPTRMVLAAQEILPQNEFSESGVYSIDNDINDLASDPYVMDRRDHHHADLVMCITDLYAPSGIKGIVRDIGPQDNFAYAIAEVDNALATFTAVHEIGHLLGAIHQSDIWTTPNYSKGYTWRTATWPFGRRKSTVMHTIDGGGERQLRYSNPDVTQDGKATGATNSNDASRRIEETDYQVSQFRNSPCPFTAYISGPTSARLYEPLSFSAYPSGGVAPYSYSWSYSINNGAYTYAGSNSSFFFQFTSSSKYGVTVRLTATDNAGNSITDYHYCSSSGLISYREANVSESYEKSIGLPEVQIYPNPGPTFVQLYSEIEIKWVTIIDRTGKIQKSVRFYEKEQKIDIGFLPSGFYIIHAQLKGGQMITKKLIKK